MIAQTPAPPYYAVIFTSVRTEGQDDYIDVANQMMELAAQQPGFLGVESARNEIGITVSYWESLEAIACWKKHAAHQPIQQMGKDRFYKAFTTRVCKVERDNHFEK